MEFCEGKHHITQSFFVVQFRKACEQASERPREACSQAKFCNRSTYSDLIHSQAQRLSVIFFDLPPSSRQCWPASSLAALARNLSTV